MNIKPYILLLAISFLLVSSSFAQTGIENKSELSVKQIMQWPHEWIGTSPSNISWSEDSKTIYFDWNPEKEDFASLYKTFLGNGKIEKVSLEEKRNIIPTRGTYNKAHSKKLYTRNGDLFIYTSTSKEIFQITNTIEHESNARFSLNEKLIYYNSNNNIYSWNTKNGQTIQISNFQKTAKKDEKEKSEQEQWLYDVQLRDYQVLSERKDKREDKKRLRENEKPLRAKPIYTNGKTARSLNISPDGKFITFTLNTRAKGKSTIMPDYVTESGYTESIPTRRKVGEKQGTTIFKIYDIEKDTLYELNTKDLVGLNDKPKYFKEYPELMKADYKGKLKYVSSPLWSKNGENAIVETRSQDNKHRWILLLDIKTSKVEVLSHQQDDAWINGPGIGYWMGEMGWINDKEIWFQSEESGYSHLYSLNIETKKQKTLTKGKFEIFNPQISRDGKLWYFTSNASHPGVKHFCKMPIDGGKIIQITSTEGNNEVYLSPDETKIAIRYSFANKPWELYIAENKSSAEAKQITFSTTKEFKAYKWRVPEVITFKSRDGRDVHARVYKPKADVKNKAAVIFVHGAGYLHNAHKWWSTYFREYMFNNMLTDNGYTVLDIDYAGSAGYGRDWRTEIYRHMGGKDLTDQTDGAKHLIKEYGIDPEKIGIYGGSYGGFISIFALLKENKTFTSAAAVRSVTDWAHYNHGYTSNILNTPVNDPIAYQRSSPIYFADGLKNNLLILHGMLDNNVHFQDVILLQQQFIELGKENWELVPYPMEAHGFIEPSSWTDEYQRIFKLFQQTIGK